MRFRKQDDFDIGVRLLKFFAWLAGDIRSVLYIASASLERFNHETDRRVLENGIAWLWKGIKELSDVGDKDSRKSLLNALGIAYMRLLQFTGDLKFGSRAIFAFENAAHHSKMPGIFLNLGSVLRIWYEQTGSIEHLDKAEWAARYAVNNFTDDPHKAGAESNLGHILCRQYKETGSFELLDEAIKILDASIPRLAVQQQATAFNNLGNALLLRAEATVSWDDLRRAVIAQERAVRLAAENSLKRVLPKFQHSLGQAFMRLYARTGITDQYNRAFEILQESITATPRDYPQRHKYLNSLAELYYYHFSLNGNSIDSDTRGEIDRLQLEILHNTQNHPNRVMYIFNRNHFLLRSFTTVETLNDIISSYEKVLKSLGSDDPSGARGHYFLAHALQVRFLKCKALRDKEKALVNFKKAASSPKGDIWYRLHGAQMAINILSDENTDEAIQEANTLNNAAIELLPLAVTYSLYREDQLFVLRGLRELPTKAANIAILAGERAYDALRKLERGSGIVASLTLDTRAEIEGLEICDSALDEEFRKSCRLLELSPIHRSDFLDESTSRHRAVERFSEVIRRIRSLERFERFLLPHSEEEMIALAARGPVVIVNPSSQGCFAFLVTKKGINALKLPKVNHSEGLQRVKEFSSKLRKCSLRTYDEIRRLLILLLEWLWDCVAESVLIELGFIDVSKMEQWPRMWWVLRGWMSMLPIHAAGYHSASCLPITQPRPRMSQYFLEAYRVLWQTGINSSEDAITSFILSWMKLHCSDDPSLPDQPLFRLQASWQFHRSLAAIETRAKREIELVFSKLSVMTPSIPEGLPLGNSNVLDRVEYILGSLHKWTSSFDFERVKSDYRELFKSSPHQDQWERVLAFDYFQRIAETLGLTLHVYVRQQGDGISRSQRREPMRRFLNYIEDCWVVSGRSCSAKRNDVHNAAATVAIASVKPWWQFGVTVFYLLL